RDIYPVKIVETMGRYAGWLPASAALARSTGWYTPHLIYIPERTVDIGDILSDVQRTYRHKGYVVIVLSENVKCRDGRLLSVAGLEELQGTDSAGAGGDAAVSPNYVDPFGHAYYRHMSTGYVLSELITRRL